VAVLAAALAAPVALLSGCTPADKRVTALRYVDDRPVLLIACPTLDADRITVYSTGVTPRVGWHADRITKDGVLPPEATLFEPPTGWTVTDQSLTTLDPGTTYEVALAGFRRSVPINFTTADLEALPKDRVLVGEPTGKAKVVTEKQFRATAEQECD
jgi:hypothetical protein